MENLEDLEDLFDEDELDIENPTDEQLYEMYGIYLNDFVKNKKIRLGLAHVQGISRDLAKWIVENQRSRNTRIYKN